MSRSDSSRSIWASIALLGACAACCALPLIVPLGVGSIVTATFGRVSEAALTALLAVGGVTLLMTVLVLIARQRMRRAARCSTQCSLDSSCCRQRQICLN